MSKKDFLSQKQIQLARKVFFSAAHFYKNEKWSDEKNKEVFGPCFSPYGHGHNYTLECYFTGYIDERSGLVINLFDIDKILKRVVQPFDHHHINFEVEAFKHKNPTTENLAVWFFNALKLEMAALPVQLTKVRLSEEEDLWVDYPAV